MRAELLLVGCGQMGAALAAGLHTARPGARILALDPDPERARRLLPPDLPVEVHAEAAPLAGEIPALTVLAVKPQVAGAAMATLAGLPAGQGLVVSIMAGIRGAALAAALPGARVVRAMPNTPALHQAGMTGLWAGPGATAADRTACTGLFGTLCAAAWVEEEGMMDAVTALSGSGPAYVFAFAEAMERAGRAMSLPGALAAILARQTVAGAARMLLAPGTDPAALKAAVRSPAGTTDAALRVFEAEDALDGLVARAMDAARSRAQELAGK